MEHSYEVLWRFAVFIIYLFIGVFRRFQHYFSYIMATVHLFMIPG